MSVSFTFVNQILDVGVARLISAQESVLSGYSHAVQVLTKSEIIDKDSDSLMASCSLPGRQNWESIGKLGVRNQDIGSSPNVLSLLHKYWLTLNLSASVLFL